MRLSSVLAIAGAFAIAGLVALIAARFAVTTIESSSKSAVLYSLDQGGLTWSEVETDGLQVYLAGTAPSEAARFRALTLAGGVVDATRLIDQMLVEETSKIAAPRFSMEILRNDSGISLIGLIPASMDKDDFLDEIQEIGGDEPVSDFLEAADYPAPESWQGATAFALRSLRDLERAKISMDAKRIAITAITGNAEEKSGIEASLNRRVPDGLKLALDISAPRPVITPFTLRFVIDEDGARFDACSADTDSARDRILSAARQVGMVSQPPCTVGLGVPSPTWADAVVQSVAALSKIGGGVVTFSDADIALQAVQGTDQALFDDVIGGLENSLPEVFALKATLPAPVGDGEDGAVGFTATLSPEGLVQLRGRIASGADRKLIDSFAMARFTSDNVRMSARVDETMPDDWTVRIMAGLDALSYLSNGAVRIEPDTMSVSGSTGQADAGNMISALLTRKLAEGADFSIDVNYIEKLDPIASIPTPEECEAGIAAILAADKIQFEPGSANLNVSGKGIMDGIADLLKECGELTIEIGGHTDSQGRETMNQQLSQARAQTVLNELRMRRVLTGAITAIGYGETQPIADNGTEEGREANRRIEFKVIQPEGADNSEEAAEDDQADAAAEAETELETSTEAEEEQSAASGGDTEVAAEEGEETAGETDEQN